MRGWNWHLEDDLTTVSLTLPTDPPIVLKLGTSDVEDTLKNLGDFRTHMKPEIAPDFAQGQKVSAILDPKWVTEPDALMGDSLLHFRDPRYGWLHYLIPKGEARKLVEILQKQIDAQPPEQGQGKLN